MQDLAVSVRRRRVRALGALVANGRVYVVDGVSSSTVRAFDATTGQAKWSTPLPVSPAGGEMGAVANGLVYVVVRPETGSDRVVAFDQATGAVRWRTDSARAWQ